MKNNDFSHFHTYILRVSILSLNDLLRLKIFNIFIHQFWGILYTRLRNILIYEKRDVCVCNLFLSLPLFFFFLIFVYFSSFLFTTVSRFPHRVRDRARNSDREESLEKIAAVKFSLCGYSSFLTTMQRVPTEKRNSRRGNRCCPCRENVRTRIINYCYIRR